MSGPKKRSSEEEEPLVRAAEKKKQKVTQPHGLYNQGATCYLNSVLQVLFMTTEIHDRLVQTPKSTDEELGNIFQIPESTDEALGNIFQQLKETTCGTENITKSLEIKHVYQQRDAAECLELILRNVSQQVSEVFQGQLTYTTKCSKGHSINEETNSFWTLPLSLKDTHNSNYSVESGFESIFETKSFSGDNLVYCNECKKKTEATKGCEMVKFPQILILLLKRFYFDYNTMSHVKSDRYVDVPRALQRKKYELYGMVNHMGNLRDGHYTATILPNNDTTWYEFNDHHVTKVEEQPFANNRTFNSNTAYLLIYRASGHLRDKKKEQQNESDNQDEQREHKRKVGERDTDNKENRHLQQTGQGEGQIRQDRNEETVRGEGDAKCENKVSSFNKDKMEEDALLKKNQKTCHLRKRHPDNWTKTEKRKQASTQVEDENRPCRNTTTIWRKLFFFIALGALIVMGYFQLY
ncbi:ubiquitin carboxyl-terminal hydrolase 47-like isoform X2 [Thunnus albacares]|uniref:ubiquitin carboxyl-terminal hydrolase 47-like isoform X2 n=1 Tax=Thunnus albacares TaxID=8236 RepID=UPI001CF632EF|nr:ubiquitin carboxyl-terminal hydrolase 47-like isoform X2 [Thunnus albacares]